MNLQTVTAPTKVATSSLSGNSTVSGGGQESLSLGQATSTSTTPGQQNVPTSEQAILGNGASQQMKQYLGNYDLQGIPDFPTLDLSSDDYDVDNGQLFENSYQEHCLSVVKAISDLNFTR